MAEHLPINDLIGRAEAENASDIHIAVGDLIYMRKDGHLVPYQDMPVVTNEYVEVVLSELISSEQIDELNKVKELDFSYQRNASAIRGNAYVKSGEIAIALRILPELSMSIDDIGIPPIIYEFLSLKQGLILVTGPTGVGKSTSLASMLEYLNQNYVHHIITIEDPVEYVFKSKKCIFSQREIGRDTFSYQRALRSALREDPDVVVISEMRDAETISAALRISETGHLVFGTLHTSGAAQTISRMMSAFPPIQHTEISSRIAASLLGTFSQHLLPRAMGGRIAAFECMVNTPAVANIIRTNELHQLKTAIQTGIQYGMVPLRQALEALVESGEVSEEHTSRILLPDDI